MGKYISLGDKKTFRSGTSIVLAIPAAIVRKNKLKVGEGVEVLWDGQNDMLVRLKEK